jgi:integrase
MAAKKTRIDGVTKRPGKRRDGSEKWEARVPDPSRPGRQIARTFRSAAAAKDWRRDQLSGQHAGDWIDPRASDQTFTVVADAWRQSWVGGRVSAKTALGYEHMLKVYLLPQWGTAPVSAITTAAVQTWVHALSVGGYRHAKTRTKAAPLAPNTVRHVYGAMRAAMKKAVQLRLCKINPCLDVDLPRANNRPMRFLTEVEVRKLAEAMPTERDRLVVLLAAYSGLRAGELWALKRDDLDLLRRPPTLVVDESLKDVAGHLEFGPPKTANSMRSLTLPAFLAAALAAYLPANGQPSDLLFTDSHGGAVSHGNWYGRTFSPVAEAVLPGGDDDGNFRFHDLRHTAASLLIGSNAHPKLVSMRLGHSSVQITLDRYGHLFPSADEALAAALDTLYSQPTEPEPTAESNVEPIRRDA